MEHKVKFIHKNERKSLYFNLIISSKCLYSMLILTSISFFITNMSQWDLKQYYLVFFLKDNLSLKFWGANVFLSNSVLKVSISVDKDLNLRFIKKHIGVSNRYVYQELINKYKVCTLFIFYTMSINSIQMNSLKSSCKTTSDFS